MKLPIYFREDRSSWYVRIPQGDATYKHVSLRTESERDAEKKAASMLSAVRGGGEANVLWQDLVERFKRDHFPELRPNTRETYLGSISALTRVLYDKHIRDIDSVLLERFTKARLTAGAARGGVRADLAALSSIMGRAIIWRLLERNPVPGYIKENGKRLRRGEPRERYLSADEEKAVLTLCEQYATASDKGPSARLTLLDALIVAIDTGLRIAEIMGARWDEIDWKKAEIYVPKERAKSGRSRSVPLLPRVYELLRRRKAQALSAWVFPSDTGDGPRVDFDRALTAFVAGPVAAAGIKKFGWHDLRRTCGCRLLQQRKLPMERVSKWLGHASVLVTERHYAFLGVRDLHESVGTHEWLKQ